MKKLKTISQLKKQADKVFSKWIREREKRCYTCDSTSNLQAGHFVSRSYLALRYSPDNVHTQCVSCNVFRNGNMTVYAFRLVEQYGVYILKEFERTKRNKLTNARKFYEDIITKYSNGVDVWKQKK